MSQPNWPGTAGYPALGYRAGFARKSLQLPFASAAGELVTSTPEILWGTGSPEGLILGSPPDIFMSDTDGLYIKGSGVNTMTGWVLFASLAGGAVARFLEYRMIPEGHGSPLNNADPIDFPTGFARGTHNVAQTAINTLAYLQGNSPDSMQFQFIDGRPCYSIAVSAINHHTSPVFRPGGATGRFPLDFFGATFGALTAAISAAQKAKIPQPMATSIQAWMRKKAGGDGSSARFFFGFADNTIVYSSLPVARCGLVGDGVGGYRYGSVNCPDGVNGAANGDTDIDGAVAGVDWVRPADLVAPGTAWWHTRIKLIPATSSTPASIACYHNGTLVANFTTSAHWPRGAQGTTHDYTRIEACLRCWDQVAGLYLHDWRIIMEDDLS